MSAPVFSSAQSIILSMIDLAKAADGSSISGVQVVQERIDVDSAVVADPALRQDGAVMLVLLPESGSAIVNRESNFYVVNVSVVLMVNPKVLPDGLGVEILAMVDDLMGAPTLYAQENLGPAFPKPLEVPVERVDEGAGYVAYAFHYTIPVLQ